MTTPLDEKAVAAAHEAYSKTTGGLLDGHPMENAIRAYLSTTPAPDGLEVVAWRGGKEDGSRKYTEIKRVAEIWADQNLTVIPLVRADQAQSVLAAVSKERDALAFEHRPMADFVRPRIPADQDPEQAESFLAWMGMIIRLEERGDKAVARAETAEAEVKRLTEENEALREAIIGLNVTDEELVRIHNSCTGVDGEVQIWAKMLHMLVANIIAVRAVLSGSKEK